MNCINLIETFGTKFRVTIDRNAAEGPRARDPWVQEIRCQGCGVTIYPHGGSMLAVEVDHRPSIVARLSAIQGVRRHQDGDHEKTFLFVISLFEQVAQIVKPRHRRQVTEEQRDRLARFGRYYGFGARKSKLQR